MAKPPVQRIDELLQQLVGQLEHAVSVERLTPRGIQQVTSCLNIVARITSQLPDLADDVKETVEEMLTAADAQAFVAYIFKHLGSLVRIRSHLMKDNTDYWRLSWLRFDQPVSIWEKAICDDLGVEQLPPVDLARTLRAMADAIPTS